MTMRDQIARAIYVRHNGGKPRVSWRDLAPLFQNEFRADADAALSALAEPTDAMETAYNQHDVPLVRSGWRAAIEAAS